MGAAPASRSMAQASGTQVREAVRSGRWRRPTGGVAEGYVQANLVVLPLTLAESFEEFCANNPRPCPLLEVTEPGSPEPRHLAPGSDIRVDLPRYRVYEYGKVTAEIDDLRSIWRPDFVAFLLGCSLTFEPALARAGVLLRHIQLGRNITMFRTNRPCISAGPFAGPLVVSMRPIAEELVPVAQAITSRFSRTHGGPVHVGDPAALGIRDLSQPDYGDPVPIYPGETPVFWACGVTPQAAAEAARLPFMITHAPGYMLITDLTEADIIDREVTE